MATGRPAQGVPEGRHRYVPAPAVSHAMAAAGRARTQSSLPSPQDAGVEYLEEVRHGRGQSI